MKKIVSFLCSLFLLQIANAQSFKADDLVGIWKTGEGTAMVKIYKNGEKYQGRIVWLKEPNDKEGKPKTDVNHPDEKVHNRPIVGLINTWDFTYKEPNEWENGKIYDPKNGKTYSCTITMTSINTIEVRGYIGVSLFGRTDAWTRQVQGK